MSVKRLFPAPYLSLLLFGLWLLLNQSIGPVDVAIGAILGFVGPRWTAALRPSPVGFSHLPVAIRLTLTVGKDLIVSNLDTARRIWWPQRYPPRSAFIRIPLTLQDPNGLAALAVIMTVVPGTVWSELAMDGRALLVHLFNVDDEEAFIDLFKRRYEKPLMEIFE